jgi:hypothetical protein
MESEFSRNDRLLALLLINQMKEVKQVEKAKQLKIAGFTNVEIADLLDTTAQVITNYFYTSRKARSKSTSKKTKKKK